MRLLIAILITSSAFGQALFRAQNKTTAASQSISQVGAAAVGWVASGNFSAAYTVGSGSNRILFVGVVGSLTGTTITAITYNSVAMTLIDTEPGDSSVLRWTALYYIVNPASGSNNIDITQTGGDFLIVGAVDYDGASQTGVPDASTKQQSSMNGTTTTTLTTVADNCWTILIAGGAAGEVPTAGTGSTLRVSGDFAAFGMYDSNGPITPAGSTSMDVSASGNPRNFIMASFKP